MIQTILTGLLTSVFLLPTAAPAPAVPPIAFTQVLPVANTISYTVKQGDTLDTIAEELYDDSSYWKTLWNDNAWITDPNAVEVGTRLTVRATKPEKPDEEIFALKEQEKTINEPFVAFNVVPTATPVPTAVPTVAVTKSAVQHAPATYEEVYKQAGEKYGIPWQILYGLHITETGGRDGMIMNGSGSGARGPMQFMPGTWRAYGVDGNGDGTADIDNAVDAIHGAANYLAKHGTLEAGLRSYGGNTARTLALARGKGYQ